MTKDQPSVFIPAYIHNFPSQHEMKVALLLCQYFDSKISFIDTTTAHTPDILVHKTNQIWEIKCVKGSSKNTIHHTLSKAKRQSENVVIAIESTKLFKNQIIGRIKSELRIYREIKRLILITKGNEILAIKGNV